MRDPRMSRRLSQAPRLSLVWTAISVEQSPNAGTATTNAAALAAAGGRTPNSSDQLQNLAIMADDGDAIKRGTLRDFCCNHVKSIATTVMMFGMIFCVVMIVMVHKWNYERNEAKYVSACHDVAIIGAGLSGSYAAWKLRHSDYDDIHVYEMSHRIGGLFHTRHSAEFPDLFLDVGATSFNTEQQPRLTSMIHAMRLPLATYHPPNRDPPGDFYLRGKHVTTNDFSSAMTSPYHSTYQERQRLATSLHYLSNTYLHEQLDMTTSNISALQLNTSDGVLLYQQGFQNVMRRAVTPDTWNLVRDTSPWQHLVGNENAALLSRANTLLRRDDVARDMRIEGGMQLLPEALMDEYLAADKHHRRRGRSLNHRLACIRDKHGVHQLIFIKTVNVNGQTVDVRESKEVCARRVILAVPPNAVRHIEWTPYDETAAYKETMDSVAVYPVLRVYFIYSQAWWTNSGDDDDDDVIPDPPHTDIYTDLSVRHVKYLGAYDSVSRRRHYVFMTAEAQGDDMTSLRSLLHLRQFDGTRLSYCNDTKHLVDEISHQMAELFNQNANTLPKPTHVLIEDTEQNQHGGSWYVWKRGALWDRVGAAILRPVDTEDVYVVGSGFCGDECQLSAEGAIRTVDELMERYLLTEQ